MKILFRQRTEGSHEIALRRGNSVCCRLSEGILQNTDEDDGHNKNNDNKIIIKNDISICRNIFGNSSQNVWKVSKIAKMFIFLCLLGNNKTLAPFMTKFCDIPDPIYDLTLTIKILFQTSIISSLVQTNV